MCTACIAALIFCTVLLHSCTSAVTVCHETTANSSVAATAPPTGSTAPLAPLGRFHLPAVLSCPPACPVLILRSNGTSNSTSASGSSSGSGISSGPPKKRHKHAFMLSPSSHSHSLAPSLVRPTSCEASPGPSPDCSIPPPLPAQVAPAVSSPRLLPASPCLSASVQRFWPPSRPVFLPRPVRSEG